jgi:dipeptidyl aminopeptidase/acylaminoacyl peptidase
MKRIFYILFLAATVAHAQQTLTPELLWKLGRVNNPQLSPDGKIVLYEVKYYDLSTNKGVNYLMTVAVSGGTPVKITTDKQNAFDAQWKSDGKIAFLSSENGSPQLYEAAADGSNPMQVTSIDGGIGGYKYSPDLKHLAYCSDVKLDATVAEMYPDLPLTKARIMDGLLYRHWDSWHDYAYSHIFISDYTAGKTISNGTDIMKGEHFDAPVQPFGGDEQFNWSPDGNMLAYVCRKENGTAEAISTNSDIYLYRLLTKNTINLTKGMPGYDEDPAFSPDGNKIAFTSMLRAGNESDKKRLMVYYFDTQRMIDATKDFDYTTEFFKWNSQGNALYFIPVVEATKNIYYTQEVAGKAGWTYTSVKPLTKGDHDYLSFSLQSTDANMFTMVGAKQHFMMPTEIFAIKPDGKENQLTFTNQETLKGIEWGKVEKRWVTTTDAKKMLVWVILPPGFDASKKYPTLLYCQGGPQSPVSQFFSYRWNFALMAARGYIVVAPNRRGLPGFGSAWNDQITGDYGGQCMQDLLSAIDDVSKEPWVNTEKRGAVGASFGGYSVYWLAGNHHKRFKTFIAHCGMFNMESWYGSTEEMWFANHDNVGPYWQTPKPKNFDASPHKFVQHWDAPILVIHNEKDFRVPLNQGMEAFTAAQLKGIKSRFLYFPDENHWVSKPQNSVLWQRVYFDWLDTYLK